MDVSSAPFQLDLDRVFPFELDAFQREAIAALDAGKSVVVCAPTGSGKTLIGEYAIIRALAQNEELAAQGSRSCPRRVFYTTPLKALSNQKLRDFRDRFGEQNIGLLTGDVSINRDAPILVMTTEIFRNMLYGTPIGEVGTSMEGVDAVVLDECHYMNDRQRGTVWEESIIYCPKEVQLVALSATVANSDQLTDWIDRVHGPTALIYSDFRPVPLEFYFGSPKGLFPLLNDEKTAVNPRFKKKRGKQPRVRQEPTKISFLVSQLQQRDMLPAIYFIFSRRGCDQAVQEIETLSLVNEAEKAQLKAFIDLFLERNPEAVRASQIEPLYRGIAAHHAGILPAWKVLVEELFQQGLIKVVFATETLAAGINMPARTTVISSLSKRTDRGHRLLTASEFLQMAGRAGRRGMDDRGYVVTVQTPFEGATEAAYLATQGADPLVSQFTPSYGMVLNLLQTHSEEEARDLIERSFGQYLSTLYLRPQQLAIADLEAEVEQQQAQIAHVDADILNSYEKLHDRIKEERRILKYLQQQAQELQVKDMHAALPFAIAGSILSLKGKYVPVAKPLPAVLVAKTQGGGQLPYFVCLGQDNRWRVVTANDVVGLHAELPRMAQVDHLTVPPELPPKPGQVRSGSEESAAIAQQIPSIPAPTEQAPEVIEQQAKVRELDLELQRHPARQFGNPGQILKRRKQVERLLEELGDRRAKLERHTHRYWQEFVNLMEILRRFGCLDGVVPTELGQIAAAIRGDNELWLGLAMASGELDDLDPHELVTVCAALTTEVSRPDVWTSYQVSAGVESALEGLRSTRRQLIKLQHQYQVALPVWMEYDFIPLVEQWALGVEWPELCANTSLDEGDIVRVLRRTLDFMSQIPHVPYLPSTLRDNARRAIALIDRFPVNEGIE